MALSAIVNHPASERINEYALRAIRDFAALKINSDVLITLKAAPLIVSAMIKHKKRGKVQEYGCFAIWQLAEWEENQKVLLKQGVGRMMINIITDPASEKQSSLISTAISVLGKLTTSEENVRSLMALNICQTLVNVGFRHLADLITQQKILEVFWKLIKWSPEAETILLSAGTPRWVEQVKQTHVGNRYLMERANRISNTLSQGGI